MSTVTTSASTDEKFESALTAYVNHVQDKIDRHFKANGFTFGRVRIEIASRTKKWVKVVSQDTDMEGNNRSGRSVHSFVAVSDFATKGLGQVEKGGVYKAASWKAPAKHKRADIFDVSSFKQGVGEYGAAYL